MSGSIQNTIIIFADVYIKKCSLFSGIMVLKFDPWMCIVEILDEIKQFLFRGKYHPRILARQGVTDHTDLIYFFQYYP